MSKVRKALKEIFPRAGLWLKTTVKIREKFYHKETSVIMKKKKYIYIYVIFGAFNEDLLVLFQFIGMKSLIAHKLQVMKKYGLYRSKKI